MSNISIARIALVAAFLCPVAAFGVEVELAGLFGRKAVLVIDGGAPRTLAIGDRTREGVRLVDVLEGGALVDIDGKTQRIALGSKTVRSQDSSDGPVELSLVADTGGHFFAAGSINGSPVRFLIDTGATMISIGASDARRAGIDRSRGISGKALTANGATTVWRIRLDTVKVDQMTLHGVDALVHEVDMPFVLLGMSFLNRMDMRREGERLVLRRRY